MSMIGICKLCQKEKRLIKQSHIIPDFMFRKMKQSEKPVMLVNFKDGAMGQSWKMQTGIFDKYILCSDCDNGILGQLDRYLSMLLFDTPQGALEKLNTSMEVVDADAEFRTLEISNFDYKKLKLGLLSLLWRAHISNNEFYKEISLAEDQAEEVRHMLLSNTVYRESVWKIVMLGIRNNLGYLIPIQTEPYTQAGNNSSYHVFHIHGTFYMIDSNPSSQLEIFEKNYIPETGKLIWPFFRGKPAYEILKSFNFPQPALLLGALSKLSLRRDLMDLMRHMVETDNPKDFTNNHDQVHRLLFMVPFSSALRQPIIKITIQFDDACKKFAEEKLGFSSAQPDSSALIAAFAALMQLVEYSNLPDE